MNERHDVHLVDGTYELFRAFYGAPSRVNGSGREVGAARALAFSLISLITKEDATHISVAFDHVIESFRNDLFEGYKTGAGIDPDLWNQFGLAEEVTRALGLVCWPMVEFEADDALAAAAKKLSDDPRVGRIHLCSPDKDLMQCIRTDRVVVVDRRRKLTYGAEEATAKMGVPPDSIPDYLALVGDSADGIPGLPRWGAKSAGLVLTRFGRLEQIPDSPDDWDIPVRGKQGLADSLRAGRDSALLYRTLATLRTDVPLREELDDLAWQGADRSRVKALAAELDDPKLVDAVPRWREASA